MKDHEILNSSSPLVSVLMTAYNREKYIREAIESVLASTYTNFELIIVDDCSKDKTVKIAKEFAQKDSRISVYVNEENLGDYPNRNKAAAYAKGKYIKYVDADDLIYPHGLEVMVYAMEKYPEAGFGLASKSDKEHSYPMCISPEKTYLENFLGFNHFDRAPGSAIIKKSSFQFVNGFSGKQFVGDQELWLVLARKFKLVKFPIDLYWWRQHDSQQIKLERKANVSINKIRKKLIEDALNHADCPLVKKDIKRVRKIIRLNSYKGKFWNAYSFLKNLF